MWILFTVCIDNIGLVDEKNDCYAKGVEPRDDGACYTLDGNITFIYNLTLAKENDIERTLPSEEYLE